MRLKTVLSRLLDYLHSAVFEKSPDAAIAFRMSREGGLIWSIADEVLSVRFGSSLQEYNLAEHTIGSLVAALAQQSIIITQLNTDLAGFRAIALVESQGNVAQVDGGLIFGFTNPLWGLYSAYSGELRLAKRQVYEALRQMVIGKAQGEWLALWGRLFGVPAKENETELSHQSRIPEEAFRFRVNKYAIQKAVKDLTGLDIRLRANWEKMFRLDSSRLSGGHRLVDGKAWRYGYLQPYAKGLFDWQDALEIIDRNIAAGVVVFEPVAEIEALVSGNLDGTINYGCEALFATHVTPTFDFRLDHLRLGITHPHRNWTVAVESLAVIINVQKNGSWRVTNSNWDDRPWNYGVHADELDGTVAFKAIATSNWRTGRTWRQGGWARWDGQ